MVQNESPGINEFRPAADATASDKKPAVVSNTSAVVLAGVHAWGGNALDRIISRPLLPIGDRPLIAHILTWLGSAGVRKASICANSGTAALRARLTDGRKWGIDLEYYEDVFPRGPAGCVADALFGRQIPACIVIDGTIVPDIDLEALLAAHHASQAALTVVAAQPDQARGETASALKPLGIYVFSPSALESVPPTGYQDIKESLIPRLYAQGRRVCVHIEPESKSPRVIDTASYLAANRSMLRRLALGCPPPPGFVGRAGCLVHEKARVDSTARIVGPVLIGPGSVIESGAIISGPGSIGAGCAIGRDVILSRSVAWDGCQIGAGAVVDHCVLTDGACVDAGLVVRNSVQSAAPLRVAPFWKRRAAVWGETVSTGLGEPGPARSLAVSRSH